MLRVTWALTPRMLAQGRRLAAQTVGLGLMVARVVACPLLGVRRRAAMRTLEPMLSTHVVVEVEVVVVLEEVKVLPGIPCPSAKVGDWLWMGKSWLLRDCLRWMLQGLLRASLCPRRL